MASPPPPWSSLLFFYIIKFVGTFIADVLVSDDIPITYIHVCISYWVTVKCETKQKRNGTKRNRSIRNETNRKKRNRSKRNENKSKRNETKRNETNRNETKHDMAGHCGQTSVFLIIRKSFSNTGIRNSISNIRSTNLYGLAKISVPQYVALWWKNKVSWILFKIISTEHNILQANSLKNIFAFLSNH